MTTLKNPVYENHSHLRIFLELSSLPTYCDTKLICLDGEILHNRLFVLLMFPQIIPCTVLGSAENDTILLPDFTMAELNQEIQWALDIVDKSKMVALSDQISVIHTKNEPSTAPENLCQVKVEDDEHDNGGHDPTNDDDEHDSGGQYPTNDQNPDLAGGDGEINVDKSVESNHLKPFSINEMLATLSPVDSKAVPYLPNKSSPAEVARGVIDNSLTDGKIPRKRQKRKRFGNDLEETKAVDDNECYFKAPPGPALMNQEFGPEGKKKRKERKRKDPSKPINPYKEKDDMSKPYKPVKMTYKDLPKNLMCTFCPYRTYHISNLTNHMRTHTGEKPYPCSFCGEKFRFSGVRNLHEKTHTGEKEYACQYCGKEFARRYVMILHERTHTGEKPFSCDFCGKRFTRHSTKINHERSHKVKKDIPTPQPSPSPSVDIDDKNRISAIVQNTSEVEQACEPRSPPPTHEKHRTVILATSQAQASLYDEKPRVIIPVPSHSASSDMSLAPHQAMSLRHLAIAHPHPAISPHARPAMSHPHLAMSLPHPVMSEKVSPHEFYEDKPVPHFSNVKSPHELDHPDEDSYGPSSPRHKSPIPPNVMVRSELASAHAQALERLQRSSIFNPVQAHAFLQNYGQQGKS